MATYFFGPNSADLARLQAIEHLHDLQSRDVLISRLSDAPDSRVAELGPGAGSILRWLRQVLSPSVSIVAVDQDISLVRDVEGVGLIEADLTTAAVCDLVGTVDLLHACLLLSHLGGEPLAVLADWIDALAPGGWLVVEDIDASDGGIIHGDQSAASARRAIKSGAEAATSASLGQQLPGMLLDLGLTDVGAEGRVRFSAGSLENRIRRQYELMTPETRLPDLTGSVLRHSMLVSAWGRRQQ